MKEEDLRDAARKAYAARLPMIDTECLLARYREGDKAAGDRLRAAHEYLVIDALLNLRTSRERLASTLYDGLDRVIRALRKNRLPASNIESRIKGELSRATGREAEWSTRDILDSHKGKNRGRLRRRHNRRVTERDSEHHHDLIEERSDTSSAASREDARDTLEKIIDRETCGIRLRAIQRWQEQKLIQLAYCQTDRERAIVGLAAAGFTVVAIAAYMRSGLTCQYIEATLDAVEDRSEA